MRAAKRREVGVPPACGEEPANANQLPRPCLSRTYCPGWPGVPVIVSRYRTSTRGRYCFRCGESGFERIDIARGGALSRRSSRRTPHARFRRQHPARAATGLAAGATGRTVARLGAIPEHRRRARGDPGGRPPAPRRADDEVALLAGAAEGFALLPNLRPTLAAVIAPSFTEPDVALRAAGVPVHHVVLHPPFGLAGVQVPDKADLVVVGNPTNPTGVVHTREHILSLRRPGRIVVVDEAFADAVPGEPESLADQPLPDVLVLRSLP